MHACAPCDTKVNEEEEEAEEEEEERVYTAKVRRVQEKQPTPRRKTRRRRRRDRERSRWRERLVLWVRHGHAVIGLNGPNSVRESRGIERGRLPRLFTALRRRAAPLRAGLSSDRTVGVT